MNSINSKPQARCLTCGFPYEPTKQRLLTGNVTYLSESSVVNRKCLAVLNNGHHCLRKNSRDEFSVFVRHVANGATEIAGVDNVARAKSKGWKRGSGQVGTKKQGWTSREGQRSTKKQGCTTREWTRRHEETGVDNAGVSDRENNVLVALSLHAWKL